jgi:hypothetical protein
MASKKHLSRYTEIVLEEQREIFIGKRDGSYYINENGEKVYLTNKPTAKPNRRFKPKRGAFYRSIQNQLGIDGEKLNLIKE